jgi:O-antigen/teichoic acid export membrane protein
LYRKLPGINVHNERRILLNTTVLSTFEGLSQLANLLLIVSFARTFGTRVMGYYSVGMSAGAVAAIFVGMGIPSLLIREISQNPDCANDRIAVLFPVQLLLTPIAWVAACVVGDLLIGTSAGSAVVMAAAGYQVLLPMALLLLVPLQALEHMAVFASCMLAHRLLTLILGLLAIWLGFSASTVALAFIVGAVVLLLLAWIQASRYIGRLRLRWRPSEARQLYREAAPFFGLSALGTLYGRGSTIVLSALTTAHTVGLYAAADRLLIPLGLGPSMFNAAAYPALARVTHSSLEEARALSARCLRLLLVVAIPLAAFTAIFAVDIVRLFFGTGYLAAAPALQILAWAMPIRAAQALFGSQLAAMKQQSAQARARFLALCLFLVLLPVLILSRGFVGAAWAVLICDALQLSLWWSLLRKAGAAPTLTAPFLAPAAAATVTAGVNFLLTDISLVLRLIVAAVVMVAGLWAFGAIKMHDLRFLRALMASKKAQPQA